MSTEPKEAADLSNSAPVNEEGKSEEFLNFERGMKCALGLSKEQVREVIQKTPPDQEEDKTENS
jgi:hypothetical protein